MLNNRKTGGDPGARHARQMPLIGTEGQERLQAATVLVAGAGGLGSPVLLYLAAAGVGRLIIADCDAVEETNLNRQVLHWERDVGRRKVRSAEEKLRAFDPAVEVVAVDERITEDNAGRIAADARIIIDCLDNFAARFALNDAALDRGIPFVHGAVRGFHGQVTTMVPGQTACMRCLYASVPPAAPVPVLGTTAGVVGMIQANEAIKYLAGTGGLLCDRLLIWDGARSLAEEMHIARDPGCVCSADSGEPDKYEENEA
jgi:molybdopterin/thiamine biosynthesis adenylyltransferase